MFNFIIIKYMKKKKEKKKIQFPMPSTEARLRLIESGKKRIDFLGLTPIDPRGCECGGLIKAAINLSQNLRKPLQRVECSRVSEKGMRKYRIVCKKCGEVLAYFYNTKPVLDNNYCDLHYTTWYDKDGKRGCACVNQNKDLVNFECHCGNRVIKEPRETIVDVRLLKTRGRKTMGGTKKVKGFPRYTRYKILKAK